MTLARPGGAGPGWGPGWSGHPGADTRPGTRSRGAPVPGRSTPRLTSAPTSAPTRGSASVRTAEAGTPSPGTTPSPDTTPGRGRAPPAPGRAHPGWCRRGAARTEGPADLYLHPPATPSVTCRTSGHRGFPLTARGLGDPTAARAARQHPCGWHSLVSDFGCTALFTGLPEKYVVLTTTGPRLRRAAARLASHSGPRSPDVRRPIYREARPRSLCQDQPVTRTLMDSRRCC